MAAAAAASTAATNTAAIFTSPQHIVSITRSASSSSASVSIASTYVSNFMGACLQRCRPVMRKMAKISGTLRAAAPVAASPVEVKEYKLPTWAEFELGRAPIQWKTMNGFPPTAGEKLMLFYNPATNKLIPDEHFGIAFNGFNQSIICGGEPRAMLQKFEGKLIRQFALSRHASPSMMVVMNS